MGVETVALLTAAGSFLGGVGAIGSLFGIGQPDAPEPPKAIEPKMQKTQAKDKSRGTLLAGRSGRADTIKTTPTGVSGDISTLALPTLTGR